MTMKSHSADALQLEGNFQDADDCHGHFGRKHLAAFGYLDDFDRLLILFCHRLPLSNRIPFSSALP